MVQKASQEIATGMLKIQESHTSQLDKALQGARQYANAVHGNEPTAPACTIAYYLYPQCKVIGGDVNALKFLEDNAERFGLKCQKLAVSGAVHTYFMRDVSIDFKAQFKKIKLSPPLISVHSNTDGKQYSKKNYADMIRRIVRQVYCPVRWEQTMHILFDRDFFDESFPQTYECGPGSSLGSLLQKNNSKAYTNYHNVMDMLKERKPGAED